jgi:hypothetical protein
MRDIHESTKRYEDWLYKQLGGGVVEKDLADKHEKMAGGTFSFLRATYWRWAETILQVCPELADAPAILSVGDIHLENYGTWRDHDGRLAWGINDFDEAAVMPYVLDIVRLAVSAVLGRTPSGTPADKICGAVLEGYSKGLKTPMPIVLDRDYQWLRTLVEVSDKKRDKFWEKIGQAKSEPAPTRYRKALDASMPEAGLAIKTARRTAGAGSLGRPRWIGVADWCGAPVVREAKALVSSAWLLGQRAKEGKLRVLELASGPYRAADPWFSVEDDIAVRRLSPNNRKIEIEKDEAALLSADMLSLMGRELANVHLGGTKTSGVIRDDLANRKPGWLGKAVALACESVARDFRDWQKAR